MKQRSEALPSTFQLDGWRIRCQLLATETNPEELPVLYLPQVSDDLLDRLAKPLQLALKAGSCRPFLLVAFRSIREDGPDFSPWPAPALGNSEAFNGGGTAILDWLCNELKPYIEKHYPVSASPADTYLCGYSLAGLFSLWALYRCDLFRHCACCSGSLWFDGWPDFMREHRPVAGSRIYLSLGRKEEKARSRRMARVGEHTRLAADLLSKDPQVLESSLQWHDGNHFYQIDQRLAQAILWLLRPQRA